MAVPEVQIKNGSGSVKLRNPVNSALLDFFTLGIYGLFWYYYVNREMVELGRARGTTELGENATTSLLALIPGGLIIVPAVISVWNTCKRGQAAQRLAGAPEPLPLNNVLAFILMIVFAPAGVWYIQSELNKVWASETEGGAAQLPGAQAGAAQQTGVPEQTDAAQQTGAPPSAPSEPPPPQQSPRPPQE